MILINSDRVPESKTCDKKRTLWGHNAKNAPIFKSVKSTQ